MNQGDKTQGAGIKQTLIFITIIMICGSLVKPPSCICGTQIKGSYFLKGKLVHVDIEDHYHETHSWPQAVDCGLHKKRISFSSDSAFFEVNKTIPNSK